jgi:hypothetical protein
MHGGIVVEISVFDLLGLLLNNVFLAFSEVFCSFSLPAFRSFFAELSPRTTTSWDVSRIE